MFGWCVCSPKLKKTASIDPKNQHFQEVQKVLSSEEQVMLELIYEDLASRNKSQLLTFENFLLFFGFTGLWGAKLFRQFDQDGHKLITKEQFFYGISRTAKASHGEKNKLLFNFLKDDRDNGIRSCDFTKMLYNYSRDDLKQILIQDKFMLPELNRALSKEITTQSQTGSCLISPALLKSNKISASRHETVIQLNYEEPNQQQSTSFGKNYTEFGEFRDPGTILHVKLKDLTYKVNFCNMITLVKQFTRKIYNNYDIDMDAGIFTFELFNQWIQSHPKLFQSYYTSFHTDIWSYCDSEPVFLSKVESSFKGKLLIEGQSNEVYGMLLGDVLLLADSPKNRKYPFKVLCLDGLTMEQVNDQHGSGISFDHRDECYKKCLIYFQSHSETMSYLRLMSLYQGDTLHDLYNTHQMVGTGKFSIVYRCTQKRTGKIYALKDITTQKLTSQAIATLDNQSQIMKIISYPQIVTYKQTIRSKQHIYIITQYIYGKDLYQYVRRKKQLSQYIAAYIIGRVIQAVSYLHSLKIIHRDLKPDNIMVMLRKDNQDCNSLGIDSDFEEKDITNVKIIDFGLSNHLEELEQTTQVHGIAGTPNYIPPEVIMGAKPSFEGDIFAIGSILYFLLSGRLAFSVGSIEEILLQTARGEYDVETGVWKNISEEAKDLISRLLEVDPEKRISLQQAINHEWFQVVAKRRRNSGCKIVPQTPSDYMCSPLKEQQKPRPMSGSFAVGEVILQQRRSHKKKSAA